MVTCDAGCRVACTERPGQVTADPDSALSVIVDLVELRAVCDARRASCAQCFDALRGAGVIR